MGEGKWEMVNPFPSSLSIFHAPFSIPLPLAPIFRLDSGAFFIIFCGLIYEKFRINDNLLF